MCLHGIPGTSGPLSLIAPVWENFDSRRGPLVRGCEYDGFSVLLWMGSDTGCGSIRNTEHNNWEIGLPHYYSYSYYMYDL